MATFIKAGFWEKLCKPCKGYKGWLNLDQLIRNNALPYKVYTAFVTQSGTDDPVVETIFENTIGEIVWEREEAGIYYATSDNLFTEDKTFVLLTLAGGNDVILYGQRISDSTVGVYSDTLTESVELNGQFQIEIRVYN